MKKILNSKFGIPIIMSVLSLLSVLFTLICCSIKLEDYGYDKIPSLLTATFLLTPEYKIAHANIIAIGIVVIDALFFLGSTLLLFIKRKRGLTTASAIINLVSAISLVVINTLFSIFSTASFVMLIFTLVFTFIEILLLILLRKYGVVDEKLEAKEKSFQQTSKKIYEKEPKMSLTAAKILLIVCCGLTLAVMFMLLFFPFITVKGETDVTYTLIMALSDIEVPIYITIIFGVIFISFFLMLLIFANILTYFRYSSEFGKRGRMFVLTGGIYSLVYFLLGYGIGIFQHFFKHITTTSIGFVPLIISVVILIVCSIAQGRIGFDQRKIQNRGKPKKFKFEPLAYLTLLTIACVMILFVVVLDVKITSNGAQTTNLSLTGLKLIKDSKTLEGPFQIFSFLIFAFLLITGFLYVFTIISFFSKSNGYYKLIKVASIIDITFLGLLGMMGVFFAIASKLIDGMVLKLLESYNVPIEVDYQYTIKTQCIYLFLAAAVVMGIMIARRQFNLVVDTTEMDVTIANPDEIANGLGYGESSEQKKEDENKEGNKEEEVKQPVILFDPCAAFTELDSKEEEYKAELERRKGFPFGQETLPNVVRFIVDYARESRLHLSYTVEDIATFVAGLGASRLTILQGMSGTGKTSLPKIFAEAILGNCEIVEVESSWRDKNELLGYYNEFSKCYTPKKFTQCLYKAKLNPEALTFIVLDEMNLSRIEYYFSDFLSLMENEEDKREIKLLNVKLARSEDTGMADYKMLEEGHTMKIPTNVYFVGTANRDESTFAISDKVYDRAQTMNFNKRASKVRNFSVPISQKFLPAADLQKMFDFAIKTGKYEAEDDPVVKGVERLLSPYNISFGNRILKQMEDFVKIYTACFPDREAVKKDAVEKILLSKVVAKLETKVVENKEQLALEFDRLNLKACSEFIRKLNED